MNFADALKSAIHGKLIYRKGWFRPVLVFMRPYDAIPAAVVIHTVKSLPQDLKDYLAEKKLPEEQKIHFSPYLCQYVEDTKTILNGWNPSQEDLLATDWEALRV